MTKVSKGAGKKSAPNKKIMRAIMKSHLAIKDDPRNQTVVTLSGTPGPITYRASSTEAPLGANPKDLVGKRKVSLSKVPPAAVVYAALAMMDGANKYGAYNFRDTKVLASIYVDACKRHLDSWFDGEECADDSGVPHIGHAIACLAIIADCVENGNLIDDRPKAGNTAALIKKWTKSS